MEKEIWNLGELKEHRGKPFVFEVRYRIKETRGDWWDGEPSFSDEKTERVSHVFLNIYTAWDAIGYGGHNSGYFPKFVLASHGRKRVALPFFYECHLFMSEEAHKINCGLSSRTLERTIVKIIVPGRCFIDVGDNLTSTFDGTKEHADGKDDEDKFPLLAEEGCVYVPRIHAVTGNIKKLLAECKRL
ncbi:MAG: hypothetical protein NT076_00975 [Candidatus Pacearchaeota archaeon]|nr:hypothetical protein [Candidatus Pacearchaeota archaeon]